MTDTDLAETFSRLDIVKDVLTVRRVFGEAYQADGTTVIPVAVVRGGGGAGGGTGERPGEPERGTGTGSGVGFGANARPLGVYVVQGQTVTWQPAVDLNRIVLGGQLVFLAALLLLRGALVRRRRH